MFIARLGDASDFNKVKSESLSCTTKTRLAWSGARKTLLVGFSCFDDIRRISMRQMKKSGRLARLEYNRSDVKRETWYYKDRFVLRAGKTVRRSRRLVVGIATVPGSDPVSTERVG